MREKRYEAVTENESWEYGTSDVAFRALVTLGCMLLLK